MGLPGDTFDLQCYLLKVDENGSYYLQVHGNKAELKSLKDFDRYEYPVGSVILNDKSEVVGFLAFGEKDEILPLFIFPEDQQGKLMVLSSFRGRLTYFYYQVT